MKALSLILMKTNKSGVIDGFQVRRRHGERKAISYLFEDDTLFFCDARKENLEHLNWILMWFQALLEVKIYLEKSELIPTREVSTVEVLKKPLGCKVGTLLITYSRMPFRALFKSSKV